jgi:hypothetical protein
MVRIPSVSTCTSSKSATDFDIRMSFQSDPFIGDGVPVGCREDAPCHAAVLLPTFRREGLIVVNFYR